MGRPWTHLLQNIPDAARDLSRWCRLISVKSATHAELPVPKQCPVSRIAAFVPLEIPYPQAFLQSNCEVVATLVAHDRRSGLCGRAGTKPSELSAAAIAKSVMVLAARSKVCAVSKYSLLRCEFWTVIKPSRGSRAAGRGRFGASSPNCGHFPCEF
jgi:hypothetical protein